MTTQKYVLVKEYPGSPKLGTLEMTHGELVNYCDVVYSLDGLPTYKDLINYSEFWKKMKEPKDLIITFKNGHKFSIDTEFIANMRTEYYSSRDGFEKGSKEWIEEFDISMREDEILDWVQNNLNWSDIENEVTRIVEDEYDYSLEFGRAKFKIQ